MNAEVLSSDFATGLDLLADVLLNPSFPADAFEREREVQIANIQARKGSICSRAPASPCAAHLFGDTGYGLDTLGTEESVTALKSPTLKAHHQKLAVPNNCVLAIYGDVKAGGGQSRRRKSLRRMEERRQVCRPRRHSTLVHLRIPQSRRWKPATKNKPSWSSVSRARPCTTRTVMRWN